MVALLVAVLALARDVIGYQVIDPAGERAATPAVAADKLHHGPKALRMIGGKPDVLETEVDLDSTEPDWGVNRCALQCDLNFHGDVNGIEEAYGHMARSPADQNSCRAATEYGYTLSPKEAKVGAQVCVRTDLGRYAGLVVKQVRKSDRDHVELVVFEVTVWNK
ncbi:MAG: hypothetical protein ABW046_19485 [Actinoplanes sp.]